MTRLARDELVVKRRSPRGWAVTPRGRTRAGALVGSLDAAAIEAQLAIGAGAELGNVRHTLIPPVVAPAKWQAGINRMLERFDFDHNVFCMTRFPAPTDDPTHYLDPVAGVIAAVKESLSGHGLTLHLASDRKIDDDLYGNVAAHMWACRYGVALFEQRIHPHLNHNLVIEVGSMLMTGRRCELLRDDTVESMPTDFIGQIYTPVSFDDLDGISKAVHHWAAEDLGLGRCAAC